MAEKRKTPEILYHYCSADAFQRIIRSKKIWLSDLSKSNDSREGRVAIDRIAQILKEEHGHASVEVDFVRHEYENIAKSITCLGIAFSGSKDRLSQWRGYGDDGEGFAIGFSGEWLLSSAILRPIYYTESDHRQLIASHMKDLSENLRKDDKSGVKAILYTLGKEILYQFKDEFFIEENEWRLRKEKGSSDPQIQHRYANGVKITYVEIPIHCDDLQPIKEIWCGPKNTIPDDFIKGMLENNGLDPKIEIKRSKGSYR
jgi:hypothetical protein